jgi:DNA helicase-2/ATP-dependent DNA helicase PcrA
VIETALFNAGVPYRVYGGLRFFERAEIKHALAYLRLLENPHDDTSWSRVVNFPARGIGARSLEQLQDAAKAHGCSLHDATDAVPGKAGANLRAFVALLDVMREAMANQSLSQTIAHVLEHSGLLAHYRGEREGQERVENLQELVTAAESFVTQEGFGLDALASEVPAAVAPEGEAAGGEATGEVMSPLVAFLTHAALEAGDNQAQAGEDAVQLMTVHAAKGLEFDAVFITGLEEGLFPHENALSDFDGLEEERRLMYVAITRARRRLYLSHTQQRMLHGQTRYHLRSRFLDEVPEEVLKFLTPRGQVAGGESARPWGAAGANIAPSWSAQWQAQPDPQQAADAPAGPVLKAGMRVFHNKFGEGDIRRIEGKDAQARAEVAFARHGVKWLALAVANLTPIE